MFGGNFPGIFFLTHRTKAQKFRGKFRSIFRKKFVARKKSFVQNSLCRRATLRIHSILRPPWFFTICTVFLPSFPRKKKHFGALSIRFCDRRSEFGSRTELLSVVFLVPEGPVGTLRSTSYRVPIEHSCDSSSPLQDRDPEPLLLWGASR